MSKHAPSFLFLVTTAVASAATASPTVYVPAGTAGEILVIDASADRVRAAIGPIDNPHGLAITPDGARLIVGSNREAAPGKAALPPKPAGMSEEEHRRHHSMPARGPAAVGNSYISVIQTQDGKVVRRIDVRGAVHHSLVTPDGRHAVSTHTTAGNISVIDLQNYAVVKTVATGPLPNYALATRDGKRLYVSNAGNNTVSEVDTAHWIVTRNILVGRAPEHMVLSADERTLYVNNVGDGTVSVVSLEAGKVVATYRTGREPHGIDLSDDGKTLFVAAKRDDKLIAIDLASGRARTLALAPAPYHVTAIRGTGKLYVSSRKLPKIWVVTQRGLEPVNEIPIRGEGHQMVVWTGGKP